MTHAVISESDTDELIVELEFRGYVVHDRNDDICDMKLLERAVEYAQRGSFALAQFYLLEAVPGLHALRATLQPV